MPGWGWPLLRRLAGLPPTAVDAILAAALAGLTIWIGFEYRPAGFLGFDDRAIVLTCLTAGPLTLRRRAPLAVLLVSAAADFVFLWCGYVPGLNVFGPLLALYTVAALRPFAVAAGGAVITAGITLYGGLSALSPAIATAQAVLTTGVAWTFGAGARRLADRNSDLLDLAEQLRREREERARDAVVAERVRIARELHDVIAHHMAVISVQAGLARYVLRSDPATAHAALDTVADTSHEALEEMRRLLAVLRIHASSRSDDDRPAYDPSPGLAHLDALVERVRAAGVEVTVTITGPVRALPSGADVCAYRVVQESLTNVLKHARPGRASVDLRYCTAELTIVISNDGAAVTGAAGAGLGLIGMRERAGLYGGRLEAGADDDGGFTVRLTLPLRRVPSDTLRAGEEARE